MNIATLTTSSRNAGGLFYSVRWLSKELVRQGCRVEVFSPEDEYTQVDREVWSPVSVEVYPSFGPMQTAFRLAGMLSASNAELVHLHGIWLDNQRVALRWQKKTRRPVVISPRGMLDPWAVRNSAWKKKLVGKWFANESLHQATCIHALCQSEADSIRSYGVRTPVAVIPNAVELPPDRSIQRVDGKKKLLYLGRIHPKKGLDQLISGWARVRPPDWELVIAGWDDGGHEAGLRTLANDKGVQPSVKFIGPKFGEEKDALFREVDCFILPSFSEGLPMSVLEAWSYSLPVLMSDFCNLPEGFDHGAALRIEPDVDSLTAGVEQLQSVDSDELRVMGANGRRLVESNFTWDRVARDMLAVYGWCLGGEKPTCITTG